MSFACQTKNSNWIPTAISIVLFRPGNDAYPGQGGQQGTMNFNALFAQSEINYLNASRYGNSNQNDRNNMREGQMARERQQQLHRKMDQIKRRWFPSSYKKEQQMKRNQIKREQLGLKHIPDAVPEAKKQDENAKVIKQIKSILVAQQNFKRFQFISSNFAQNKMNARVFFYRFKNLFQPLCSEAIWVDILRKVLPF